MPKQSKSKQTEIPAAKVVPGTKDPILGTGPPKDAEDWKIKNARAKELIMSTLVPGSEPWKIAEPLELASDIWKALEARYAPKDGKTAPDEAGTKENSYPKTQSPEKARSGDTRGKTVDLEAQRREEAKARAKKEFFASMPNRDQRFLWALLHGGKEETNTWFYGTDTQAEWGSEALR